MYKLQVVDAGDGIEINVFIRNAFDASENKKVVMKAFASRWLKTIYDGTWTEQRLTFDKFAVDEMQMSIWRAMPWIWIFFDEI